MPIPNSYASASVARYMLTRTVTFSFISAFLSVFLHYEAYFGCEGLFSTSGIGNFPYSEPLKDCLAWTMIIAVGLCVLSTFFSDNIMGIITTKQVFYFGLTVLYSIINYWGGNELFSRDYDILLLEVGILTSIFGGKPKDDDDEEDDDEKSESGDNNAKLKSSSDSNTNSWALSQQVFTFALFRYLFTYLSTALVSNNNDGCDSLWNFTWLSYSYEFPEPSPFTVYLRYHTNTQGYIISRIISFLLILSFLFAAPLAVLTTGRMRSACLRILTYSILIYFLLLQSIAWTLILLIGLIFAATPEGTCLIIPNRMIYNWGCHEALTAREITLGKGDTKKLGKLKTNSSNSPAAASGSGSLTLETSDDPEKEQTDIMGIVIGLLVVFGCVVMGAFSDINLESIFAERERLKEYVLIPIFLATCFIQTMYIIGNKSNFSTQPLASNCAILYAILAATGYFLALHPEASQTIISTNNSSSTMSFNSLNEYQYGKDFFCPYNTFEKETKKIAEYAAKIRATAAAATSSSETAKRSPNINKASEAGSGSGNTGMGVQGFKMVSASDSASESESTTTSESTKSEDSSEDDTRDASGNLSRKYTGTSKVKVAPTSTTALRKSLNYAMILPTGTLSKDNGLELASAGKGNHYFQKIKFRLEEEEERPLVGIQAIAHRVEMKMHLMASNHMPGPAIEEIPKWFLKFMLMTGRKRRGYWSFLREAEQEKEAKTIAKLAPIFRIQVFRQFADIDYDLRSNRWWEDSNREAATTMYHEKQIRQILHEQIILHENTDINSDIETPNLAYQCTTAYANSNGNPDDYKWRPWMDRQFQFFPYTMFALLFVKSLFTFGGSGSSGGSSNNSINTKSSDRSGSKSPRLQMSSESTSTGTKKLGSTSTSSSSDSSMKGIIDSVTSIFSKVFTKKKGAPKFRSAGSGTKPNFKKKD